MKLISVAVLGGLIIAAADARSQPSGTPPGVSTSPIPTASSPSATSVGCAAATASPSKDFDLTADQTKVVLLLLEAAVEDAIEDVIEDQPRVKKASFGLKAKPTDSRSISFSDFTGTYKKKDKCKFDIKFIDGVKFALTWELSTDWIQLRSSGLPKIKWISNPDPDTDQAKKLFGCTLSDVENFFANVGVKVLLSDVDTAVNNEMRAQLPRMLSLMLRRKIVVVNDIKFVPDGKRWRSTISAVALP